MNHAWLTLEEAAERIRVSPRTLYAWREAGRGPRGSRVGRRILFLAQDVDSWVLSHAETLEPAAAAMAG